MEESTAVCRREKRNARVRSGRGWKTRWSRLSASTDPQFLRSSLDFIPRSLPSRDPPPATRYPLWFRREAPLVTPAAFPPPIPAGCALPLTASRRKPIEISRISPFSWTFTALCLTPGLLPLYSLRSSHLPMLNLCGLLGLQIERELTHRYSARDTTSSSNSRVRITG
ncbi:hypothetical protein PUN28_001190 [Cardiocondyla obscurior]|uniref:Uncharacterized protein n=1 Tax=Cardiocondyla obscurior TaxID=286306 RepID=A0AAW2H461_9HYME